MAQKEIKNEMNQVIKELEQRGIKFDDHSNSNSTVGLGDAVESVLTTVGITEERFKEWFGLEECNCSKRKKWLNNLFSWQKNQE